MEPAPTPADEVSLLDVARFVGGVAMSLTPPIAAALSYTRNESIPWAIAHCIIAPTYLVFRGVEHLVRR